MESVGELLRTEREAQGKTIADVGKITKMSTLILEALEDDRYSVLPAPVYVKGHLRTYARFLGLDEDEIVEKYLRFTQQQENEELDEWDAVELELHEERERAGRRWVWIAVVVVAVVIAIVAWVMLSQRGDDETEQEQAERAPAITTPVQEAAAEDSLIEWHKLELLAIARERTWIRVSVDGVAVSDLTLDAGEERTWEADESFRLDVGNGGGLELYLDGEYLGTAGSGSRLVEGLVVDEDGMSR